ncbi:MAG: GMC family oxidoreductase, partial [Acidobacteria bacterium]|nr:GMC family oxidoreductase [Acidobacteriota bacterium]
MKIYDVCIIGSGASGGMTANVLTKAGLNCAMLEAGPMKSVAQFPTHRLRRWNLPNRGLRGDYFQEWLTETGFLADKAKEPYSVANNERFDWWSMRAVGGKSLFWAGVTPRFGPNEFQPKDDFDTKWPLTYDEIAPYYDRVEELLGVSSTVEAVGGFPLNKGLAPFRPKPAEVLLTKACESLGRGLKVLPIPKAILSQDHKGRPACHYCGPCWQGCDSGSKFDSLRVFIMAARNSGKLDLIPNARVRNLELGKEGTVQTVRYFDTEKREWRELQAKSFILCAGAIESSHILLNSKIANSSGLVGKYLSEHLYTAVGGHLPQLMNRKVTNEDGNGAHVFIPDLTENWRGNKFIRGYQIFPTGGTNEFTLVGNNIPGYGKQWMDAVRAYYTAGVSVQFQGEVLPYKDNRIELDPTLKDDAGIPAARFNYAWHENERAMFKDMIEVGNEILHKAGAEMLPKTNPKPDPYGHSIHYVGTTRMGNDPRTSVTNKWSQSHDVPNLFINDGGPFVTAGNQNPTLTILA